MINQITTMRLPDGSEVAFVDWQDKPLFSTVDLLSGFTDPEIEAFTYVPGDRVPATQNATAGTRTSTERDTNVSTPGSMASTEELLVYAIKPVYREFQTTVNNDLTSIAITEGGQPTPSANRLAVLFSNLTLRLFVSQKVEQEATLDWFNTGFGATAFAGQDRAVATAIFNRGSAGVPSQEAVRSYVIPIHIGGQEKYRVALVNGAGATVGFGVSNATPPVVNNQIVMQATIHLDGLYKRPVT